MTRCCVSLPSRTSTPKRLSARGSPLLFGYRKTPPMVVDALEDLLLGVGRLADAVPEIAELDSNP